MLVSIHQPHYLPWLRYIDKIARSDVFILLDDVEFTKNGWQNRNRIKAAGGPLLLTVPVLHKAGQKIREVRIQPGVSWARRHWKSIVQCYRSAPFFDAYGPGLALFYEREWDSLLELGRAMLEHLLDVLGITTRVVVASELGVTSTSSKRLVELVQAVGGTAYLTGAHALQAYLDAAVFQTAGVGLRVHRWECGEYPQRYPRCGFVPDLALLDLLFMRGPDSVATLEAFSGVEDL